MNLDNLLKLVALLKEVGDAIPALVGSVKGDLTSEDEAKLKDALADLQSSNAAKFVAAKSMLENIAKG